MEITVIIKTNSFEESIFLAKDSQVMQMFPGEGMNALESGLTIACQRLLQQIRSKHLAAQRREVGSYDRIRQPKARP